MVAGYLVLFGGIFLSQAQAASPCQEAENQIVECIAHPEWKGGDLEKCDMAEMKYRRCAGDRRNKAKASEIANQEIAFSEKKLASYKKAQELCVSKAGLCAEAKTKLIKKMIEGLPKEISKLKEIK